MNERGHQEILELHRIAVEDLDRTKRWQWRDFYSVLIAQAALVGLYISVGGHRIQPLRLCIFSTLLVLLGILGSISVWFAQRRIGNLRRLIEMQYQVHFEQNIQDILQTPEAQGVWRWYHPSVFYTLLVVATTFSVFVLWSVAR